MGQKDSSYMVKVGVFKCSPDFKLQDSATLSWANSGKQFFSYYDEKKKQYVKKEELIEPQDKFLRHLGQITPKTFYFPKRIDSVLTIRRIPDSTGKVREITLYEKIVSDYYEFMNLHDSICVSQLEKFWQSTIEIINSGKKQKFKSCGISILYSDGLFFNTYIKNPTILKNKKLSEQLKTKLPIIAVSIGEIWFKADNKKEYNIDDGFAWKTINCD